MSSKAQEMTFRLPYATTLPEDLIERLRKRADSERRTQATIVELALEEYLKKRLRD